MTLSQYFGLIDVQARFALKADAAKYFLGYIWWVLEPLLFVGVFYVVFNVILVSRTEDFLIFLMCGKLPFVWFSKSISTASNSIVSSAGLIGNIDIPKTLFPMAKIQEGLYRQMAVFVLLFGVLVSYGYPVTYYWLWLIPIVFVQYLMIVGFSFVGAMLVCFVRDFTVLISLAMTFLMFVSGIFWDPRELANPEMTGLILTWNPLAFILDGYRQVLMYQQAPELNLLILNALIFGLMIFFMVQLMRKISQRLAFEALS